MELPIQLSYFIVAVLFILGLKAMSSPVTARRGILWAGIGMVLATLITFATPGMGNHPLMIVALVVGGVLAAWLGRKVKMTDMPQMVAVYNGMGGGAAAAIAALEFARAIATARPCLPRPPPWRCSALSSARSPSPAPASPSPSCRAS